MNSQMRRNLLLLASCQAIGQAVNTMMFAATALSVATFLLTTWTGDLAISIGGLGASREELDRLRATHGLDRPLLVQYLDWAGRALTGDLGRSFFSQEDVAPLILSRLPVTATLAVCSIAVGVALAFPLGIAAAAIQPLPPVWRSASSAGTAEPVSRNCPGASTASTARRTWFQIAGATCHSSSRRGRRPASTTSRHGARLDQPSERWCSTCTMRTCAPDGPSWRSSSSTAAPLRWRRSPL
jgi:hypothetical protein